MPSSNPEQDVASTSHRKLIHIDVDDFYASAEERDNPELRGKPMGGSAERGVVAAASYEARKFGVRSAMSSVTARRQCPDLIFVRSRFEVYRAIGLQIRELFVQHTAIIEPLRTRAKPTLHLLTHLPLSLAPRCQGAQLPYFRRRRRAGFRIAIESGIYAPADAHHGCWPLRSAATFFTTSVISACSRQRTKRIVPARAAAVVETVALSARIKKILVFSMVLTGHPFRHDERLFRAWPSLQPSGRLDHLAGIEYGII